MDDRQETAERHRAGLRDHVLLGDPALEEAVGESLAEGDEAAVEAKVGVEGDEARLALRLLDDRALVGSALDESLPLARRGAMLGRQRLDQLDRLRAQPREPRVEAGRDLLDRQLVLVGGRRARVVARRAPCR